ncbi:hypothetical protein, unknown function [Leishmania tarentolae]|uniref:Uncharacterized protein n=1 Tax=Leishmania tarentolae TaxID=5689 RepID=A0A640KD10_LEITA|nr:hypothetical protein, unknown function [Leishmania tarentolae]
MLLLHQHHRHYHCRVHAGLHSRNVRVVLLRVDHHPHLLGPQRWCVRSQYAKHEQHHHRRSQGEREGLLRIFYILRPVHDRLRPPSRPVHLHRGVHAHVRESYKVAGD